MSAGPLSTRLAKELSLSASQIERTVELLDTGNTIPFIARYRKEATGGLDEVKIEAIQERSARFRAVEQRREDVLRLIAEQDKLTPALEEQIGRAVTLQELDDLYLPYRPKRKTRASVAREKGLEPLAALILEQSPVPKSPAAAAESFVDSEKGVETVEEALAGARDIVAETIAEEAATRQALRAKFEENATLASTLRDPNKDAVRKYELYYEFRSPLQRIPPHRTLAINRGEKEGVLKVAVTLDFDYASPVVQRRFPVRPQSPLAEQLALAIEDSYKRLLAPALEREMRSLLTEAAEKHATTIFATNLRPLLLQPPLRNQRVMGIDPGFRTGCKVAVVDETGKYLEGTTIYPHPPQKEWECAKEAIRALAAKHGVSVVAIGNGTASRETEALVGEIITDGSPLAYVMVSEAGASVYSASAVARSEFPDLDASQRGNISIARRLQDPLAELVKIDPKSVGVGLYQHDVEQKDLEAAVKRVVESCVNFAGVEVNSASASLLQYVSGVNKRLASQIVSYRDQNGPFESRDELRNVPGLGEATFVQCAGFLKIRDGRNPLDNTFIHPESYSICDRLIVHLPASEPSERLTARAGRFRRQMAASPQAMEKLAAELRSGTATLADILENLEKPGLDPRDSLPKPILRKDVLKMEDLQPGMILQGTVRNVVDFGAFVDIGVKSDGLIHVSQLADGFVRNPTNVVAVGDIVTVRVISVDALRGRIQLSRRLEG